MGRIAAIDYGLKRIGVALSDPTKLFAQPLENIIAERKQENTAAKVLKILSAYDLEAIVVGLPLLMSGKSGFLADEVKSFVEELKKITDLPIITLDERLTSVQADRVLREAKMTRKKRSQKVDALAAVILLQTYLDSRLISDERD